MFQDEEPKIRCTLNKNHQIPQRAYKKHLEKCSLSSAGYEGNEDFLSEPPSSKKGCVKISNAKKAEIFGASRMNRSEFRLGEHFSQFLPNQPDTCFIVIRTENESACNVRNFIENFIICSIDYVGNAHNILFNRFDSFSVQGNPCSWMHIELMCILIYVV